jgi:4-amino-4-deoxy-L-arabinose transferase-like glycosyltransferase
MQEAPATAITWPRGIRCGLVLVLAVGILWRISRYLACFPIWGDEAFILLNLLDLDYRGLAGGLQFAQVAPLLFLWTEETALNVLGSSELALRLASMLAGVGGLLLFWRLCRDNLAPLQALLAVAVFAVAYFPVRHSCEVKPYAFDLFWSVALYWAALRAQRTGRFVPLVLLTPLALVSSYPVVFVAGALSLVLLPVARQGRSAVRCLYVLFNVLLVVTFFGHYALVGCKQASPEEARKVHDFMHDYWRESFPPSDTLRWPAWLLEIHSGNMLAYPIGGKNGASAASFCLLLLGAAALLQQRRFALLAACLLPFALNFVAAVLGRYPYGGSARVAQHLAAPICLLIGVGIAALLEQLRSPERQQRWGFALAALLAAFGVGGLVYDLLRPYKTLHDWEVRHLTQDLAATIHADDTLLVCNHPDEVATELRWYLRNEKCALRWLGRAPAPALNSRGLWLLFLDLQPTDESRLRAVLGQQFADWVAVDWRQTYLSRENNIALAWYCTRLRLVPPGDRVGLSLVSPR